MSDKYDRQRISASLPADMLIEMKAEAKRLDRPLSWIVQQALKVALPKLRATPETPNVHRR